MTTFAPTGEYLLATATAPGTRGSASIALQPPPGGPGLPGVVDLGEVELGIEGTWDASTGTAPLSRATFESMLAAAQDPEVDAAPVHFGHFDPRFPHLSDGEPAVGWIRPTRITQRPDGRAVLMGRLTDVPASLVPVIRHGYKRRSVEFGTDLVTPSGRRYPAVLSGLGLLGVRAPAVKGLRDLADRYLAAPTMPATVALQAVVVDELAASDTPPPGGWFPVAATVAGHDGRAYPTSAPTGELTMTQRFTDQRIRELLALSATDDVSAIQAGINQLPAAGAVAGQPVQPAQPQPPAGYFIPAGYAPAATAQPVQQPAAPAQQQQAQGGVATLQQPVAGQPLFQPVPVQPATASWPPAAQQQAYLQPQPGQPAAPLPTSPGQGQAFYPQPQLQFAPAAQPAAPYFAPPAPAAQQQPVQYGQQVAQPGYPAQPTYPVQQQPAQAAQAAYPTLYPVQGQQPVQYGQPDPTQQQVQPGQPVAQQQPVAQPGYVAAAAGQPANPAGMVLMSTEAAAQVGQMLGEHTRNRRDVAAWSAFSAGKISAAEYPGVRAELDRNEAGAMAMLNLLAPGRYPVQAYGAAGGAGVNPGQLNEAAYTEFERGILGDRVRPAQQQQQAGAPAAVGSL